MVQNPFTFNANAYLQENPDIAADGFYSQNPYEHYQNFGQQEGRKALFDIKPEASDPSTWTQFQAGHTAFNELQDYFKDEQTGNVYSRNGELNNLVASGDAYADEYSSMLTNDPYKVQELFDLKSSNPDAYYSRVINDLNDQRFDNYSTNENRRNIAYIDPVLEKLKEQNPAEYYKNQMEYLGRQMGWQIGQNTSERNAPIQQQINSLIPEALKAGVSTEELNQIIGGGMNQANQRNQQRIANDAQNGGSGFNFKKDILPGLITVGAGALGMYGIDSAIAAAAAAGSASTTAGALTVPELLASSGGFVPAAGSGASFSIVPGASYGLSSLASAAGAAGKTTSSALTLKEGLGYLDKANKAKNLASQLLGGGSGSQQTSGQASGGGGVNNNLIAALGLANTSNQQANQKYNFNANPFALNQPTQTIVDADNEKQKPKKEADYGIADLLRNFKNYG